MPESPDAKDPVPRAAGTPTQGMPPHSPVPTAASAVAAAPAEDAGPPEGADALREDIERTRDRMSLTLDRIEGRIVRRRDEVWSKATLQEVRETVASEPWRGLLIAFAAGYMLAALRD